MKSNDVRTNSTNNEFEKEMLASSVIPKTLPFFESELVSSFIEALKGNFFSLGQGPLVINREVSTGRNIADIVAFFVEGVDGRLLKASLSTKECVFLSGMKKRKKVYLSEVLESYGEKEGRGLVDKLIAVNAICIKGKALVYVPKNIKIIAFEAKVKDWKKALKQAASYLNYADESYVVMPTCFAEKAKRHIDRFKELGVGLIVVDDVQFEAKTYLKSQAKQEHNWRRQFVYTRSMCKVSCE